MGYSTLIAGPDAINVTANPKAKGVNIDVELGGQQCSTFPSQNARAEGTGEKQDAGCTSLQANFPSGVNLTAGTWSSEPTLLLLCRSLPSFLAPTPLSMPERSCMFVKLRTVATHVNARFLQQNLSMCQDMALGLHQQRLGTCSKIPHCVLVPVTE